MNTTEQHLTQINAGANVYHVYSWPWHRDDAVIATLALPGENICHTERVTRRQAAAFIRGHRSSGWSVVNYRRQTLGAA